MCAQGGDGRGGQRKGGADTLIGPTSLMKRFTNPRAGLPVNTFVRAVWCAASLFSAVRCTALMTTSGQSR